MEVGAMDRTPIHHAIANNALPELDCKPCGMGAPDNTSPTASFRAMKPVVFPRDNLRIVHEEK